jgi:peroxiredoxin
MTGRSLKTDDRLMVSLVVTLASMLISLLVVIYRLTIRHGQSLLRIEALEHHQTNQTAGDDLDNRTALYTYGMPPGSVAMNFDLPSVSGRNLTLYQFRGRRVLLIFVAPDCPASIELLTEINNLNPAGADDDVQLLFVSSGEIQENRDLMQRLGVQWPVVVQHDNEVATLVFVSGTPMAYMLNAEGITETHRLEGVLAITGAAVFVKQGSMPDPSTYAINLDSPGAIPGLKRADTLPAFSIPMADGVELTPDTLLGRRTLIIMFDPLSPACRELLPDLAGLHSSPGAPDIVMISRRDPDLTTSLASSAPMPYRAGFQANWEVSRMIGILAAPVAFVVSAGGLVESDPAVGHQAVLDLVAEIRPEPSTRRLVSLASLVR